MECVDEGTVMPQGLVGVALSSGGHEKDVIPTMRLAKAITEFDDKREIPPRQTPLISSLQPMISSVALVSRRSEVNACNSTDVEGVSSSNDRTGSEFPDGPAFGIVAAVVRIRSHGTIKSRVNSHPDKSRPNTQIFR
ncbi:hypothetical protein Cob_v011228 [Colletotrichum orbiculare MAFF 240422]|uniref:Uncharacterized protein n=1 Tax=Colletotrichum orbiculare (strain 104-T / ATCC 96160 / CBS 514.97 / LARS 414 / MAFF 240422) TaxID=1213857 RepID=A0A484FCT7_COLOR|nr:hypothetical protein Cob_v011228 [Colletotrichum orbiculare MAFF 240422]